MKYETYLIDAIKAALQAGDAVLEVYDSDFRVETKADDSPLTLADQTSHKIIKSALSDYRLPFISEEGRWIPYEERRCWRQVWIVDPLDGTKEFVKRSGEFTVNIALVEDQHPVLGVVYAPVPACLYFATTEIGAFKLTENIVKSLRTRKNLEVKELMDGAETLPIKKSRARDLFTIVGSRSHGTRELEKFVAQKQKEKGRVDFIQAGSSLKICLVAEGAADVYPRLGPTSEWDTAAGQAVAECAGATFLTFEHRQPLIYNKPDLLNPWFLVEWKQVK